MEQRRFAYALALAATVLALTLFAVRTGVPLPWDVVQPDTSSYLSLASNLAEHGMFSSNGLTPTANRELGYPVFLSLFVKAGFLSADDTARDDFFPVLAAQALLYLLTLFLLGDLARRLGFGSTAPAVVLLGVFYVPLSQYAFQIVSEVLAFFLATTFFYLLNVWEERGGNGCAAATGLLHGLLSLVKSVVIPFPVFLAVILWWRKKLTLPTILIFLAASLLLPAAWTVRNSVEIGRSIVGTEDGASSLYRGNLLLGEQPPGMDDPAIPASVRDTYARLAPQERNAYLLGLVKERLKAHPLEFGLQLGFKAFVLLLGLPIGAMHLFIMASRMLFLVLAVSRVPAYLRRDSATIWAILAFAGWLFSIYTLIYSTPRYFAPAWLVLLPLICESARYWAQRSRGGPQIPPLG